ncbi:hypothetical protein HNI00_21840 [Thermoleptolyngbya oregonensis NK1-22]|uniref:Uncharacterized protein n=1 Tax=Thermoleptolyngbya oregonensis NK1-22 TaxID=2547457 RepID=A0AA97BRH5_9CYAN|nr:hypothetical protein [Thermoleptolyngbya oregonensis]WOB45478.1 hypothetical protein HNI00_21840 [Thermoleptolyngbya oregonensis NK1-22]
MQTRYSSNLLGRIGQPHSPCGEFLALAKFSSYSTRSQTAGWEAWKFWKPQKLWKPGFS